MLVDDSTPAYYNAGLGTMLDGTGPQFPRADLKDGDPTVKPAPAPNLAAAAGVLGNWLSARPVPLSGSWSGPRRIPTTWALNTETAIVYAIDAGAHGLKNVKGSFGVDNGVFVWANGVYKFGALEPGGATAGEYTVDLGDFRPGVNYVQVLREDHGYADGYTVQITAAAARVHIGSSRVSVSERLKRLARELRGQAADLDRAKHAVEDALPKQKDRIDRAEKAVAELEPQLPPILADIERTRSFLGQIGTAEQALPDSGRTEIAARDSLDNTVSSLQDQIVHAEEAGNTSLRQSLESRLGRTQSQLDVLVKSLAGKEGAVDELRERWVSRLRALNGKLFALRVRQAEAEQERALADGELKRALGRRAGLDDQLLAVAEQLDNVDFAIENVSVTADGRLVYKAELLGPFLDLQRLDAEIAALGPAKDALDASRHAAMSDFLAAGKLSSAALAHVADQIMTTAYKKAAVDFVANGIDVLLAARKGGLIGASTETLKKVVETLGKEYGTEKGSGKYGSKGATEFNSEYNAKLSDAFLAKTALKIGAERIVKDSVLKYGKDTLNRKVGTLVFEKVYGSIPELYQQAAGALIARGVPSVEEIRQIQSAVDSQAGKLGNLGKGYSYKLKDLGISILKDVTKNSLKLHFDVQEQQAWIDYFEKETIARMYFALYQVVADKYWQAYDYYNELLTEKAKLLEGYDPTTHSRTTLDETFPGGAGLKITLTVVRTPGAKGAVDLGVLVAGKEAARGGGYEYSLPSPGINEGAGGLGLEIRAR